MVVEVAGGSVAVVCGAGSLVEVVAVGDSIAVAGSSTFEHPATMSPMITMMVKEFR